MILQNIMVLNLLIIMGVRMSGRHEILFCHDLLNFLKTKYSNSIFKDDFQDSHNSHADFYFYDDSTCYLVEAKSDIEADSDPDWNGTAFSKDRSAIKRAAEVSFDENQNNYGKWIIFLAQLNYYAQNKFNKCKSFEAMLGFPQNYCEDIEQAISIINDLPCTTDLLFNKITDSKSNVGCIIMKKTNLKEFISSIQ